MPASSCRSRGAASRPASSTSSWLSGSAEMPAARLVTSEMPEHLAGRPPGRRWSPARWTCRPGPRPARRPSGPRPGSRTAGRRTARRPPPAGSGSTVRASVRSRPAYASDRSMKVAPTQRRGAGEVDVVGDQHHGARAPVAVQAAAAVGQHQDRRRPPPRPPVRRAPPGRRRGPRRSGCGRSAPRRSCRRWCGRPAARRRARARSARRSRAARPARSCRSAHRDHRRRPTSPSPARTPQSSPAMPKRSRMAAPASRGHGPMDRRSCPSPATRAGAGPQLGHVVVRRPGRLGRVGQDAQGHRTGYAALEVVQHVDPGRLLAVQGGDPDPDLAVEPGGRALPLVQGRLVDST